MHLELDRAVVTMKGTLSLSSLSASSTARELAAGAASSAAEASRSTLAYIVRVGGERVHTRDCSLLNTYSSDPADCIG
ncbi:jg15602 [Pararge aegeria aegeria]|uniref:Jg15602 protein n=1 Tax=Pararge aegeria aegeria TaxID=348720 RepID=A0A8S4RSL9_9NEOP|nr:jg15602 [Pararge aegeria aegeria]